MRINNFLWLAPFICFISGYNAISFFMRNNSFEAPNLVGMQLHEACSHLACHKLTFKLSAEKMEPDLPSGTILSQMPRAQQKIRRGQTISCVVSTVPPTPRCPQLLHTTEQNAQQAIHALHTRLHAHYIPNNYPRGTCFAQSPAAQHAIPNGEVTAYFSSGNNVPMIMPDFTKYEIEEVIEFLRSHRIEPEISYTAERSRRYHQQPQRIVDQRPLAGSLVTLSDNEQMHVQLQVM